MQVHETIKLRESPAQVWKMIVPAEHGPLLSPETTLRGFPVPGTPGGVGHQQCFVDLDGNNMIIEVVEYEHQRWAATRTISPRPEVDVHVTHRLEPLGDGCLYSFGLRFEMDTQAQWPIDQQQAWRAHAQSYLQRVRQALAAEA